ncbi:MAG: hypothetical protein RLZZ156_272 [Deinococcota bacterium]|jgi:hypothetical protein
MKTKSWRWNASALATLLVVGLVACPTPVVDPPVDNGPITGTDLLISEVGSAYYRDQISWFEVFNPTNAAIDLAGYTLRARGIATNSGNSSTTTWNLPAMNIPAGGYAVVGGKVSTDVFNTNKSVYVANGNVVPFWFDGGFLELLKGSNSVDFVRWGDNSTEPTNASAWNGTNAPALPVGKDANNRPTDLGKSIVRAGADINNKNNWSSRNYATPAAPNDVPASASDNDNDGIPDSAEVTGGKFGGLDLFAMGARTNQRDIFMELDNMTSNDPGLNPQKTALDLMVAAFAAKNFSLHIDAGDAFSAAFDPANYNLGNAQRLLPYSQSISLSPDAGLASSVYELKSQHFDFTRSLIFYYMVLGSSQRADGAAGSSGLAEILGNDGLVTFGGWGFNPNTVARTNNLNNRMASTIMHEFGHNLNLRHGGNEDRNYKPNYISIMSYAYQLDCIGPVVGTGVADRYFYNYNPSQVTFANLVNNPNTTNCKIDYSDGSSSSLNENALNEAAGMGRGAADVDWNVSGTIQNNIAKNLNPQSDATLNVLTDHDDWSNIRLGFSRMESTYTNSATQNISPSLVPASHDHQEIYPETAPSPEFFERLREEMK